MITSFPFRMADAAALAEGALDPSLIRVIVKFDQVSNAGSDDCPRWVRDGDIYAQVATFEGAPSCRELEAAIEASFEAFPKDGHGVRYTYLSYEPVQGDELCAYEQEQIEQARSVPEYFRDDDLVYGVIGAAELAGAHPARWAPPAYARALLAAREEGLKAH
ncbi:hypothetical protein [Microvirga massiliensis]|uniref:hypothetical protein n=1 Tax=Microvirga massiliensis TaxID=1033741 RepID=UPI00062B5807|nr:hypothetical protein [Microvirga massiliensis]